MQCSLLIEKITAGQPLKISQIKSLLEKATEILSEESNLIILTSPINIIGDIHGQFYDVLKIFKLGGSVQNEKYLFIGDYVDRGYNSFETIVLLLCYKVMYPDRLFMLRGNHESRQISCMYGFYEELNKKYGTSYVWELFNETFDYLPLAATIDDQIFCVHGGLSPEISSLDQIHNIDRQCEIPTDGPFSDLMWSDPLEIETWLKGTRGAGWQFGYRVVDEFNHHNNLSLIVRAHQLCQEGYQIWFKNKNLATVWSAPNYCYRCNNKASIMKMGSNGEYNFQVFEADEKSSQSIHYGKLLPYFL